MEKDRYEQDGMDKFHEIHYRGLSNIYRFVADILHHDVSVLEGRESCPAWVEEYLGLARQFDEEAERFLLMSQEGDR